MISFLHTSAVHVPTFDALLDAIAPDLQRSHRVEDGWLDEARTTGISPDLNETIVREISDFSAGGIGVCTCSSIGAAAEGASSPQTPVIRIDRVLMEAAVGFGNAPLVAMCLESTREPTLHLLHDVAYKAGVKVSPRALMCTGAWDHFEAGDHARYAQTIAAAIECAVGKQAPSCVVLAQASMAPAEALLQDLGMPVLSAPRLAVEYAVQLARGLQLA